MTRKKNCTEKQITTFLTQSYAPMTLVFFSGPANFEFRYYSEKKKTLNMYMRELLKFIGQIFMTSFNKRQGRGS